jgi:hypothetical protein
MPIAGEIQAFLILTVPLRQAATPVVISTVAMAVDAVSREVVSGNNREKYRENSIFCGKWRSACSKPLFYVAFDALGYPEITGTWLPYWETHRQNRENPTGQ